MDPELTRLARRQQGLITRSQALTALSRAQLETLLLRGGFERVVPGVYRMAGAPVTWRQRVMAAVLDAGPAAAASHRTAAALWTLTGFPPKEIEIVVPHGKYRPGCHQSRTLGSNEVTTIGGIPVTRVARTISDLAGTVPTARLEDAIDDALCRRLVTFARLSARPNLAPVLAPWIEPGRIPANVAEMRLARRLTTAGLPMPERQVEIGGYRVDLFYRQAKLVIELDSFRWHGARRGHARTIERRNHLTALGCTVLQATIADLRTDGRRLTAQVQQILTKAG